MIKAIAFDFDHTLYDRRKTYENMLEDFTKIFSCYLRGNLSREDILSAMYIADMSSFQEEACLGSDTDSRMAKKIWEGIYHATLDTGIFAKEPSYDLYYYGFIRKYFPKAIALYPDTISTLNYLRDRGYVTGLLTNGTSDFQQDKLDACDISQYMDKIIVCGNLPHQKPHPSSFAAICEAMGVEPYETLFVGDNPYNDIQGAREAGLIPVWIRSVGIWPKSLDPAEYSIDVLGELPELIKTIEKT